jgi:hypothetical protein
MADCVMSVWSTHVHVPLHQWQDVVWVCDWSLYPWHCTCTCRQQPVEKRVIEYLISIPDPTERRNQLDQAVTPGPTRWGGGEGTGPANYWFFKVLSHEGGKRL